MDNVKSLGFFQLDSFINTCLFIHDDVISGLKDEHGDLLWDQYSTNPFFLGAKTCVVDSLKGFGETYLEYLANIACIPTNIIIPSYKNPSLLNNLLEDRTALDELRVVAQRDQLDISSFYSDHEKKFEVLIDYLSNKDYRPKLYPSKKVFELVNDKIFAYQCFLRAKVPIPEGVICNSFSELYDFWNYCKHRGFIAIVKKYHWQTQVINNENDIKKIPVEYFPIIMEKAYEIDVSPVFHFIVWNNCSTPLFTASQIIERWKHYGNSLPHRIQYKSLSKLIEYSQQIITQLHEYEGVLAIDFIITKDEEIFAVDLNPRFNASTYPLHFLSRFGENIDEICTRFYSLHCNVPDLSAIFDDENFVRYHPGSSKGIVLMTPFFDFEREYVTKFFYMIIAKNTDDLAFLQNILMEIIERHKM